MFTMWKGNYYFRLLIINNNDWFDLFHLKQKLELFELYGKLKNLYDDLYKRRVSDANSSPLNVSSNSNHDSGIQTNLTCLDELNYIICDIQELIKNIDFMVNTIQYKFASTFFLLITFFLLYFSNVLLVKSSTRKEANLSEFAKRIRAARIVSKSWIAMWLG